MRLSDITPEMIREWKENRRKSVDGQMVPVSTSTLRNDLYRLSVLFDIAGRSLDRGGWGIKGLVNPVKGMELDTLVEKRSRRLRPGELERMLVALGNGRNADEMIALVRITLATGMQKSEIMSITVGDIFRDHSGFHIRKNGRDIPISHSTMQDIQFLLHGKRPEQHLFSITNSQSDFAWREAKRVAQCPDLRILDIRNEAIYRFVDAGMHVQDIMNMTGHKTSSVIMDYIEPNHHSM